MNWQDILERANQGNKTPPRRVEKSLIEWKKILTPEQFAITRQAYTEKPHSGELCSAYQPGKYSCVCCETELFDSTTKFDSGTGWPSFSEPIHDDTVKYVIDTTYGTRVETVCNICDAHLGHVFPDGPAPSGIRFCINSLALKLID